MSDFFVLFFRSEAAFSAEETPAQDLGATLSIPPSFYSKPSLCRASVKPAGLFGLIAILEDALPLA